MFNLKKGLYGYRDAHKKRELLIFSVLAAAIVVQVILSKVCTGNTRIVFTVTGILTVLPLANLASPMFAMFRYKTPPKELYEKIRKEEAKGQMLYDLIITSRETIMPAEFILVRPGVVILCAADRKLNESALKSWIRENLRKQGLKANVNLYRDADSFCKALEKLPVLAEDEKDEEAVQKIAKLLKELSY
jgi:hypothetical protein